MSLHPVSTAAAALITIGLAGAASAQTAPLPAAPKVDALKVESHKPGSAIPSVKFEEIVPRPVGGGYSLTAIAIGAVAGVIVVNWLAPVFGYSMLTAAAAEAPVTAAGLETALAASRVTAVSSAVVGGVAGQIAASGLR